MMIIVGKVCDPRSTAKYRALMHNYPVCSSAFCFTYGIGSYSLKRWRYKIPDRKCFASNAHKSVLERALALIDPYRNREVAGY